MFFGKINFDKIPDIGFAMAHYSENYKPTYGGKKMSVEVAYINSGTVKLTYDKKDMYASEGSVIVLFRQVPVSTATVGDKLHSHYTVLAEFESCELEIAEDASGTDGGGLVLPFVTPASSTTEDIGRRLRAIASDMATDRDMNALGASLTFLEILHTLSDLCRKDTTDKSEAYRKISSAVKACVEDNADKKITLQWIAEQIGKSPNHIGHAFRVCNGISVVEYINSRKIKKLASLIESGEVSFALACEMVGIADQTYGYRLFKKYMGITPGQFASIKKIKRER